MPFFAACSCARRLVATYSLPARPTTHNAWRVPRRWQTSTAKGNQKITEIVDSISGLTLLETADLVSLLKSRLNIPDTAFASFAAPAAAAATAAQAAPVEEAMAEPVEEKTMFNLKLMAFEPTAKPKVIKEVKSMLGLSLVDSKKFVESAPKMLKEGLPKEEAERIQKLMKGLGAEVVLE